MKIKIKKINNKKLYIDEAMYISIYINSIMNKPNRKIGSYTRDIRIRILALLIIIMLLFISCIGRTDIAVESCCVGLCIIVIIVLGIRLSKINKVINIRNMEKTNSEVTIDKKSIILKNNNMGTTTERKWDEINFIRFSRYCIIFVNKNKYNPYIILPSEYKDEILKAINEYKIKKDIIGE